MSEIAGAVCTESTLKDRSPSRMYRVPGSYSAVFRVGGVGEARMSSDVVMKAAILARLARGSTGASVDICKR